MRTARSSKQVNLNIFKNKIVEIVSSGYSTFEVDEEGIPIPPTPTVYTGEFAGSDDKFVYLKAEADGRIIAINTDIISLIYERQDGDDEEFIVPEDTSLN